MHITKVKFTAQALKYFEEYLYKKNGIGILLYTTTKGCSGLSYKVKILYTLPKIQFIKLTEKKIIVFIEKQSHKYINGIEIDYLKQNNGFSKIIFNNDNALSSCGCGESFHFN